MTLSGMTDCAGCGNSTIYCGCDHARYLHCTHPEQTWCDCDWCRVWRGYRAASTLNARHTETCTEANDRSATELCICTQEA